MYMIDIHALLKPLIFWGMTEEKGNVEEDMNSIIIKRIAKCKKRMEPKMGKKVVTFREWSPLSFFLSLVSSQG